MRRRADEDDVSSAVRRSVGSRTTVAPIGAASGGADRPPPPFAIFDPNDLLAESA